MKKILTVIFFTALAICTGAQPFTTSWPYLYPEFRQGAVYLTGGQKVYRDLNVHLLKGRLHYLESGIVKEAMSKDIFFAMIGENKFMVVNGDMMRVDAEQSEGFVANHITGDFESLMVGTGAYGVTANTEAIQQYSSLDIQNGVNTNHMLLLQNKSEGREFDLKEEFYIVTGGKVWPAARSKIEKMLPDSAKDDFRHFVKKNKIKWKDPLKLILLVDFLKDK